MKNIKYEITEIRTTPLVLEIPQMSDERWQELTRENAVQITLGRTAGNQRAWNRRWHGNGRE
jgi:vacuolar-type H+-ATPase subunit F/Vma7